MISDYLSPILEWLNSNPELAGLATFLISAGESIAILGTIVPGSVMMTGIGALVGAGVIPFWSILSWAILGAIVGDSVSYWLGHYFKDSLKVTWPFKSRPYLLESGERFVLKYGGMSVFIGRFVGPVRALVPVVAGMLGMKPLRFIIANVTSAFLWAPIYMLPGFILGAASTELPSELAGRIILMLFLSGLLIILGLWLLKKIFDLIRMKINNFLQWIWTSLKNSRHFYLIPFLLKHHNLKKSPHQLALLFYFAVSALSFLYLASWIYYSKSADLVVNNFVFHLFRSLRNPDADHVMLFITLLGDKYFIFAWFVCLCAYFCIKKYWHTGLHLLILIGVTFVAIYVFKNLVQSPRPWGVVNNLQGTYSFPSGHMALGFTFYLAMTLLVINIYNIRHRYILYSIAGILITAIGVSRLYFGVHWFSDVIGGVLLGTAILLLVSVSYNRNLEKPIQGRSFLLTFFLTGFLCYGIYAALVYKKFETNYALLAWPTYEIGVDSWWQQKGEFFPLYRVNRFGFSVNAFNIQWMDELDNIKNELLKNDWEKPPVRDWLTVLYRISSVQSTEHLPLVAPLYLDRRPILVFIKYLNNGKLIILRFWKSQFIFSETKKPLWLGSLEYPPGTYSWLFKRKPGNGLVPSESILFKTLPINAYTIKTVNVTLGAENSASQQTILLIKPKKPAQR